MVLLLALPVFALVASVHRCLQMYAPSNLLVRHVRIAAPRFRTAVGLFALAAALLIAMHMAAEAVAAGAPGWLNIVVLALAWDAIKISWLALGVVLRLAGLAARRVIGGHASAGPAGTYSRPVSDDLSLFGDDSKPASVEAPKAPSPIADWQVDLLRKALDARGLTSMADRQQAVETAAGRAVESLRALTNDEGLQVLSRLGQQPSAGRSAASQWDEREEDTWIDRL
jgi:hypothetical protein